jgi:MFS family permease
VNDEPAPSPAPSPAGEDLSLLRNPAFRILWLSRAISYLGAGVAAVALVLLTARHGPGAVGLVLLAGTAPALLGPFAGAVADRLDQRLLLAGCEVGSALVAAITAATLPPPPVLVPLALAAGTFNAFFRPAGRGAVPALVPAGALMRANSALGTALNLQVVAGPALGGVLVAAWGIRATLWANAAALLCSALLLIRLPPLRPTAARNTGLVQDFMAGLRHVAGDPLLRALVIGLTIFVAFASLDNVALIFLVTGPLQAESGTYGVLMACFGAGMLAASLTLTLVRRAFRPGPLLLAAVIMESAGLALTGLAPSPVVAAAGQFLVGAGNSMDLVAIDTLVQRTVPRPLLGRVFGAVGTAAQLGAGIAYLAAGPLIAAAGPRGAFVIAAVGTGCVLALRVPLLAERPPVA